MKTTVFIPFFIRLRLNAIKSLAWKSIHFNLNRINSRLDFSLKAAKRSTINMSIQGIHVYLPEVLWYWHLAILVGSE